MSKKRALVLGLVLLPLAVGGGIIASLAKGTRSSDLTGLEAPANTNDLANSAQEIPMGTSTPVEPAADSTSSDEPLAPMKSTPTRQEPSSAGETITIDSDQATSEPMLASATFTPSEGGEPLVGTYGRSALYTLAGRAHASGGGGGGGGGTTVPSGNGDTDVPPDNTSKNPTGSSGESSGESSTGPSSDSDEDSNKNPSNDEQTTPSETEEETEGDDDPTNENPPVYFPPAEEPSKPVQVPEPASVALLGLGLLGCALARRRRNVK